MPQAERKRKRNPKKGEILMFLNYTVLTGPEMNCLTLVGLLYPFHKNLKNLSVSFPTVQISTLAKLEKVRKNVQKAL